MIDRGFKHEACFSPSLVGAICTFCHDSLFMMPIQGGHLLLNDMVLQNRSNALEMNSLLLFDQNAMILYSNCAFIRAFDFLSISKHLPYFVEYEYLSHSNSRGGGTKARAHHLPLEIAPNWLHPLHAHS